MKAKRMKKIMIYAVISTVGIIAVIILLVWQRIPSYEPVRKVEEIHFPHFGESIFVSTETWGISYDRQIVIIGTQARTRLDYDADEDIVYHTDVPIFYKASEDELAIYTVHEALIPRRFGSKINIRQIIIDNQYFEEMAARYNEMGLKKAGH